MAVERSYGISSFKFSVQVCNVKKDIFNDQSKFQRRSENYKQETELTILIGLSYVFVHLMRLLHSTLDDETQYFHL